MIYLCVDWVPLNFCVLIFLANLLNSHINYVNLTVVTFWFLYRQISSVNNDNFVYTFPIILFLICFFLHVLHYNAKQKW